jgi:hypothetical protein
MKNIDVHHMAAHMQYFHTEKSGQVLHANAHPNVVNFR